MGACATALESVDSGCDLIATGKARAVLVGGSDVLEKDASLEFANMGATVNAEKDAAAGRSPRQASPAHGQLALPASSRARAAACSC